ncbi:MAG: hypothetical protein AAF266_04255, partial [Planctomycetota bacterium]
ATASRGSSPTQRIDQPHSSSHTAVSSKASLSEHRARRHAETTAAAAGDTQPLRPGIEVDALPWPAVAEQLASTARQSLLDLLSGVTKRLESNDAPAIALVGTRPGVGTTTTLLAIAKLVAGVGGRVAIVDASGAGGAASSLGVRRCAHLDARVEPTAVDDLLVSSRGCGTSVLAVSTGDAKPFATVALGRLLATHDLVLIDSGDATEWLNAGGADRSAILVIDDDTSEGTHARYATAAQLESVGVTTTGFVETYTPLR